MSPEAEQRMVRQILLAYGLPEDLEPHIPDLNTLMQIDITHSPYIDSESARFVAAAAAEALTARRMCVRNEAMACLAMARDAASDLWPGPLLAAQAAIPQAGAPDPAARLMPAEAHRALAQASASKAQTHRLSPGRRSPSRYSSATGAPRLQLTQVEIEDANQKALVSVLMAEMPAEWRQALMLHVEGQTVMAVMDVERRASTARAVLLTKGASVIKRMIAAQRYHKKWAEANGMEVYPVPTDVACAALQDRMESAMADAAERKRKRDAKGLPPGGHSRGGVTAAKAVRCGYRALGEYMGLHIDGASPMVQAVTAAGPGEPTVGQMIPIDIFLEFQHLTNHPNRLVAARAGAAYLQCASSLRVIDQMRTPELSFEKVTICDSEYTVVTGTTAKSKAVTALQMRPLPWRVPLIAIAQGAEVNLEPLIAAMRECPCMWPGLDAAATAAKGYTGRPASHAEAVRDMRDILRLVPRLRDDARVDSIGGHDGRHVIPECARVMQLPRSMRDTIGYWRSPSAVTDETDAIAARAAALRFARVARPRMGWGRFLSDRYSSREGQVIEGDEGRVACLVAIKAWVCTQRASATTASNREALLGIAAAVAKGAQDGA